VPLSATAARLDTPFWSTASIAALEFFCGTACRQGRANLAANDRGSPLWFAFLPGPPRAKNTKAAMLAALQEAAADVLDG
jgi:hypothetical protein